MRSCLIALMSSVLAPVLPRLALMIFRYSQPFLFEAIISFLQAPASERSQNSGYGLIAATGLLYLSLAISLTYYQHKTYHLVTRLRGALVSILYAKTLTSSSQGLDERPPITLMSVDVDGITSAAPNAHEIWASPTEIGVAVWLLQRQIGIMCVVPLSIVLCRAYKITIPKFGLTCCQSVLDLQSGLHSEWESDRRPGTKLPRRESQLHHQSSARSSLSSLWDSQNISSLIFER